MAKCHGRTMVRVEDMDRQDGENLEWVCTFRACNSPALWACSAWDVRGLWCHVGRCRRHRDRTVDPKGVDRG